MIHSALRAAIHAVRTNDRKAIRLGARSTGRLAAGLALVAALAVGWALHALRAPHTTTEAPPPEAWVRRVRDAPPAQRPNLLLVVYDARRRDDFSLGPFGNDRSDTPFLEEFSRTDALSFEDAVSPGCWTVPVHAAIFSGLSVCQLGIDIYNAGFTGFGTHFRSLAEILALAGYHTVAYADHPYFYSANRETTLIRGFEHFNVVTDFKRYGTQTNVG